MTDGTNSSENTPTRISEKPRTRRFIIKESRRKLNQAQEEGEIDVLTQLPNRRGFLRNLAAEISRSTRTKQKLAVIYLDLNKLKETNDNGGHEQGDKLLRTAAEALRKHLRPTDTVARIGGDEFAALLPNADLSIVQKIWQDQLIPAFEASDPKVQISAGASILNPRTDPDGKLTLAEADKKLYLAKEIAHETGQSPLVTNE